MKYITLEQVLRKLLEDFDWYVKLHMPAFLLERPVILTRGVANFEQFSDHDTPYTGRFNGF